MNKVSSNPDSIAADAKTVATQHDEHEEAVSAEGRAYVELLDAVLRAAAPALLAISSAIPGSQDLCGIMLIDDDNAVWWLEDDEIVTIENGEAVPCSLAFLGEHYHTHALVDAITRVSVAIDAQLRGGKGQAIQRMRRRAEQVHAVAVLARGLS